MQMTNCTVLLASAAATGRRRLLRRSGRGVVHGGSAPVSFVHQSVHCTMDRKREWMRTGLDPPASSWFSASHGLKIAAATG